MTIKILIETVEDRPTDLRDFLGDLHQAIQGFITKFGLVAIKRVSIMEDKETKA